MKKLLLSSILFFAVILMTNFVKATSISINPNNPKVGDTVTITVTVANVHTATVTANVSGVVSGTIKVVGGDMAGNPSTFSKSQSFVCSKEGKITVAVTPDSTAVLNGQYVDVGASNVINVNASIIDKPTTTLPPETQKKSSNANLSNLGIKPNDFTGFKSGTTVYNVEVPEDVAEIEVYATAQHAKAKISGTGKKSLQPGANACSVVVTAEDGTKKTYTINVTRKATEKDEEDSKKEETDTTENKLEQEKGLSELKIDGLTLSPNFDTSVYEYKVKYIGEETKLKIDTKATQDDYVIDVTGNEELKEGENIITILVSDKDGNNVATYQVTVNKSLVDEEAIAREEAKKQEEFRKKVIIGAVAAVIVVAIIIFFIIRHKRYQRFAEEYSEVPFSGLNDEDNWGKNNNQNWEDNNQGTTQEEFSSEKLSREELKSQYLNDYNSNGSQDDFYENETPRRSRHKGKRFK